MVKSGVDCPEATSFESEVSVLNAVFHTPLEGIRGRALGRVSFSHVLFCRIYFVLFGIVVSVTPPPTA